MKKPKWTEKGVPKSTGRQGFGLKLGVIAVFAVLFALGSLLIAQQTVEDKRASVIKGVERRLELVALGRAEVFNAWLSELSQRGDRLIKSDMFRLYAAEVDTLSGDLSVIFGAAGAAEGAEGAELAEQLPMMQNILREFCTYSGFVSARILNRDGIAYLASDGHLPPMDDTEIERAQSAMTDRKATFSPLRKTPQGLALDIFVPIFPPDANGDEKPVAALMLTRQVAGKLTELLSNSALSAEGEKTRLMQEANGAYREVTPWTAEGFSTVVFQTDFNSSGNLPFADRSSLSDPDRKVYSLGIKTNGPHWWVVQEIDHEAATAPIQTFSGTAYTVAGLGILAILLAGGLAWWVRAGMHNQRTAEEFRRLAEHIENQKRLLDSINANIQEFITLKDISGKYIYVNDAFAQAVGRSEEEIIGMDTEAVFGFDTAKRLNATDSAVCTEHGKVIINEVIYLQSKRHQFQISKSPYYDKDGNCLGVVEVFRDITEFVAAQEKNRRLIRRALEALGSTIEAADPYLGGHTKLMAGLSVEVGRALSLSEMDVAELETAANLSQIGKMFVPKDILTKPERLSPEEKEIMETHVDYAYRILKDIDIDEGVLRTIYQMNERLDGSGYPKKLSGEAISRPARILSVLNAFCAMIRPRAHRGAKNPQEVMRILAEMKGKYDPEVLRALEETLSTPAGERILGDSA